MKTRNGFVTNSSSSSFIVTAPLTANVNFNIKDEASLRKYFEEEIDDGTFAEMLQDKYYLKKYNRLKKIIDAGNGIVFGSISNDDYFTDITRLMNDLGFNITWEDD